MAKLTQMSDPQYTAVTAILRRRDQATDVVRYVDTKTVCTLIAMATRGFCALNWAVIDGKRQITSATMTGYGMRTYLAKARTDADAEELAARLARAGVPALAAA